MLSLPHFNFDGAPWIFAVLTHLWQSTIVALGILVLVKACGRLSARTRRTLGWIAIAKFALPAAWILKLAERAGGAPQPWLASETLLLPVALPPVAPVTAVAPPVISVVPVLVALWATGAILCFAWWTARAVRVRRRILAGATPAPDALIQRIERTARQVGLPAAPGCAIVGTGHSPGLVGMVAPVLILPRGLMEALSPAELEAILLHECVHLQRRDNFWSVVRSAFVGLLWFNPVAWLLNRTVALETEKSCDERVLEITGDAETYARSIVAAVRHSIGLARPGFSGVTTPPVVRRLEAILAYPARRDRRPARWAAVATGIALVAVAGRAGAIGGAASSSAALTRADPSPAVGEATTPAPVPFDEAEKRRKSIDFLRAHIETMRREAGEAQQRLREFQKANSQETPDSASNRENDNRASQAETLARDAKTKAANLADMQRRLQEVEAAGGSGGADNADRAAGPKRSDDATLSVDFPDEQIRNIIRNVADLFKLNVTMPDTLQGRTTLKLRDVTWREIFKIALEPAGHDFAEEGKVVKIFRKESSRASLFQPTFDVTAGPSRTTTAATRPPPPSDLRSIEEELIDAKAKVAAANEELKKLRDERDAAVAREKELSEAKVKAAAAAHPRYKVGDLAIKFVGESTLSEEAVRAIIQLRRGGEYDEVLLDRDVRALYRTGHFKFVEAKHSPVDATTFNLVFELTASLAPSPTKISAATPSVPPVAVGGEASYRGMRVFDVSQVDQKPVAKFQARPQYPFEMRRNGIGGEVVVDFIIDTEGNVVNARAIRSSREEFEASAVAAVSKWKFRPGRKGARDVPTHMQVPIVFTLRE